MLGEGSTSYSKASFWFAKFRFGDFSLENEPRGRHQPEVNNDRLKFIVESDTPQTTRELATKFGVSIPTILNHLRQINEVKKVDRWVPNELNAHQIKKRSIYYSFIKPSESITAETYYNQQNNMVKNL